MPSCMVYRRPEISSPRCVQYAKITGNYIVCYNPPNTEREREREREREERVECSYRTKFIIIIITGEGDKKITAP